MTETIDHPLLQCSVCRTPFDRFATFPDDGLWWIEDPYDLDVNATSVWCTMCPRCWGAACDDI